jgi:hypothetical protein
MSDDPRAAFIEATAWHGTLERAEAILVAHPDVASSDIHTAAILGDDAGVHRFLERDPANATTKSGPFDWDALTHLCFSRYLRLAPARSTRFVRAATALLDAGASANTGFWEKDHQPRPEWESVLYGAAGVAHHAELTRLLLERGADPNDIETVYHSPETYDNAALRILVETGKLTAESLALMLIRKHDWHDEEGVKFLLEHGAKWTEQHGFGDNACGSLSWASLNEPVDGGDWLGCARALLDHGMPRATIIPDDPDRVLIAGTRKRFSDEVTEELLG